MKANEAPEKIYIPNNPVAISAAYSSKTAFNDIEYARTDAFIEKACSWLRNYINTIEGTYLVEEDIEKFENYMKGEI